MCLHCMLADVCIYDYNVYIHTHHTAFMHARMHAHTNTCIHVHACMKACPLKTTKDNNNIVAFKTVYIHIIHLHCVHACTCVCMGTYQLLL